MLTDREQRHVTRAITRAVHRAFRAGQRYELAGTQDDPLEERRRAGIEAEGAKRSLLRLATALTTTDADVAAKKG